MIRAVSAAIFLLLLSSQLFSATVTGTITFLTRRGQRVNPLETLVWLEPLKAAKAAKPMPVTHKREPTIVATRREILEPHVTAIPVGSSVRFPNEDPVSHNLFSVSPSNSFDLGLYRRGPGKVQLFQKPGIVNVYCNVHPDMSAVIHVMQTPHYVFADANGAFTLADVPEGSYKLVAWSEQAGTANTEVHVSADVVTGVKLTLNSRNFRAKQHLNKHGKPYQ